MEHSEVATLLDTEKMRKEMLMQEPRRRHSLQGNGRPHHDVVVESVVSELGLDKLQAF